jgi:NADPH2:quinone reductase
MKTIVMNGIGGTDVMDHVDRPEPVAAHGHVVVEIAAAGVNFMDIGVRQGMA